MTHPALHRFPSNQVLSRMRIPSSQYNLLILSNQHVEIVANKPFYKIQNIFPDL